jgi:hypothetical protein
MYETMIAWETMHTRADQPRAIVEFAHIWQAANKVVYSRTLVHVGGILPGMRAGRLGCSILLVEVMSRRVTATPGRCTE